MSLAATGRGAAAASQRRQATRRPPRYASAPLPALDSPGVALILGNEVTGVDQSVLEHVDHVVEIPTHGTKNSMNVACAATVVIFDVLRRWGVGVS